MNLKALKAQVDKISEVEQELVDSYFTEENSHPIVDENGNETGNRALNDDIKIKSSLKSKKVCRKFMIKHVNLMLR